MIKRLRGYQVESRHSILVDHSQSSLVEGDDDEGLKADSHELGLMHAAVADSSISTEIGFFYFSAPHTSAAATCIKHSSSE